MRESENVVSLWEYTSGDATFSRENTTASSYAPSILILSELCVRKTKMMMAKMWSIYGACACVGDEVREQG